MLSRRQCFTSLCCLSSFLIIVVYLLIATDKNIERIVHEDVSYLKLGVNPEITGIPATCKLPDINPWNEEIMEFVNLDFRMEDPVDSFIKTSLENGTISVQFPWYGHGSCVARCIFRKTDFVNTYGPWRKVEEKFNCDLVHVSCNFYLFYIFPYDFDRVHTQIVPVKRSVSPPPEKKYNIFVVVVDSSAHLQAHRNLPKTLHFMKERLGAVIFPYLNKVAGRTRTNGMPLLLGKSVVNIGNKSADLDDVEICKEPMDGLKTIMDDMHDAGYRTLYSEDWATTFFNHDCHGFDREISDHNLSPLIREISKHNPKLKVEYRTYYSNKYDNPNRIVHLLDYFGKFIDSYKGEPKFGWIWSTDLSHDLQSTSIALDTMLYKMLVKHQDELEDSFLFITGDHGLNFGQEQLTESAKLDSNNPMLTVSIPKSLRNSGVKEMFLENAKRLVTHYDTRATWLDIAKFQTNGLNINTTPMIIPGEKGESYLRKMKEDRNCQNLPIPPVYCLCDMEKENLPTNSTKALIMGERVIKDINNSLYILEYNLHLCGKWKLGEVISLEGVKPVNKTGMYYITVRASEPYDQAIFSTFISVTPTGELHLQQQVDRRDAYGHRGDCSAIKAFCHCI